MAGSVHTALKDHKAGWVRKLSCTTDSAHAHAPLGKAGSGLSENGLL